MKKNNQKKINTVVVTARSKNISLGQAWKMVTAIEDYPKNVEFVKKVKIFVNLLRTPATTCQNYNFLISK